MLMNGLVIHTYSDVIAVMIRNEQEKIANCSELGNPNFKGTKVQRNTYIFAIVI